MKGILLASMVTIASAGLCQTASAQFSVLNGKCMAEKVAACIVAYTDDDEGMFDETGREWMIKGNAVVQRGKDPEPIPLELTTSDWSSAPPDNMEIVRRVLLQPGLELQFRKERNQQPQTEKRVCRVGYRFKNKYAILTFGAAGANLPDGLPCERKTYREGIVFERIHHYCKTRAEYFDGFGCFEEMPKPSTLANFMTKQYFDSLTNVIKEMKKP